jgi:mercuric ion transport protein
MVEFQGAGIEHSSGPNRAGLAAVGGIAGAIAASACCVLPLMLFSLGVGGVWVGRLAALSPYQPYFIGFAVLAVGYGFRQVYRRPNTACSACARPLPKRLVKTSLWSATVLIVIALVYPYALPYFL